MFWTAENLIEFVAIEEQGGDRTRVMDVIAQQMVFNKIMMKAWYVENAH